ncbi:hypothetical protein ACF0H5_019625 [Mactra antiquata]
MSKVSKGESKRVKVDKPLAERKRRARINDALLQLKNMVLQSVEKQGSFMSKLEKADILEMTIEYINQIKKSNKAHEVVDPNYNNGFSECNAYILDYLNKDTNFETTDPGLHARLVQHMANVSSASDIEACGSGLQIVGILTPQIPPSAGVHNVSNATAAVVGDSKILSAQVICTENKTRINANSFGTSDDQASVSVGSAHSESVHSLVPIEHSNIKATEKSTIMPSTSSSMNSKPYNMITRTVSSKPRKVLGDISNASGNFSSKKQSHCVSKHVPKPFKKRITEEMLQNCIDIPSRQTKSVYKGSYNEFVRNDKTNDTLCKTGEITNKTLIDVGEVSNAMRNTRDETGQMTRDVLDSIGEMKRSVNVSLPNFKELHNCSIDNDKDSSNCDAATFVNTPYNEMTDSQNSNIDMSEQLTSLNTHPGTDLLHEQSLYRSDNLYQFYQQETFASNVWRPW